MSKPPWALEECVPNTVLCVLLLAARPAARGRALFRAGRACWGEAYAMPRAARG
jgi:hypothetical protein